MERIYVINEEKGFNKLLDKENITDINKRKEILNGLNMIDISIEMKKENENYYYAIIDNKTNEIKKDRDFNSWHNSLISICVSHFVSSRNQLNELEFNELIEIK